MIEVVRDPALEKRLIEAGYDPAPYVGQRYEDRSVSWLPRFHRSIVTLTSIAPTINGWQARVIRQETGVHGQLADTRVGVGEMFLDHLLNRCHPLPDLHILDVFQGDKGIGYELHCPGVTDECRAYLDGCPPSCPSVNPTEAWEEEMDGEDAFTAHDVGHRLINGSWLKATTWCLFQIHPDLPIVAADLLTPDGEKLSTGRYRVAARLEETAILCLELSA